MPGVLIKMGFVTQGTESSQSNTHNKVGISTLEAMLSTIPCGIPGVVFLSGGHTEEDAIGYLSSINSLQAYKTWAVSFSYGRTLTDKPMELWKGENKNKEEAQSAFYKLAEKCWKANKGIKQ